MSTIAILGSLCLLTWLLCAYLGRRSAQDERWLRELEKLERQRDHDRALEAERIANREGASVLPFHEKEN